jgi:SAM-dependent methyltransferase
MLLSDSDVGLYQPGRGVVSVPESRWKRAQAAERMHWFTGENQSKRLADDRNLQHFRRFDGYSILRGRNFSRALEIGSGAFTNLRLIGRLCSIKAATLVDPLNEEYEGHRGSYLIEDRLVTVPPSSMVAKVWPLLPKRLKKVAAKFFGAVRPVELLSIPAEQHAAKGSFDLVVSVNVLEHCMDANVVLRNAVDALKPGGILVFADKATPEKSVLPGLRRFFDAAHPIRVSTELLSEVFSDLDELFRADFPDSIANYFSGATESYYILRKPS